MNHILLFESYKSQKELEHLTYEIFKYAVEKTIKDIRYPKTYICTVYLEDYPELLNKYTELKDFIKNGKCVIKFLPVKNNNIDGTFTEFYNTRRIIIYYDKQFLVGLNDDYDKGYDSDNLTSKLYFDYKEPLLHELQHAYDHFRSKGKAVIQSDEFDNDRITKINLNNTKKETGKLTQDEIDFLNKHHNEYLGLKHEVDARFTTVVSELGVMTTKKDESNRVYFYARPWEEVFKDFKFRMKGWEVLKPKEKNRLIRRLYQFYEYKKDEADEINNRKKR